MGLIPEHWFIRHATYTGQETFFPRRHILERIETIQRLKDRYSLEEIADLLSPASSGRRYPITRDPAPQALPARGAVRTRCRLPIRWSSKERVEAELRALLAPPGSQPLVPQSLDSEDSPASPKSYSFLDLVAGSLAADLIGRGLSPSTVRGGVETLLAGASQFSTLDDVHLAFAEVGEPPAEFSVLYSGLERIVFGHGVNVLADVAVGPIRGITPAIAPVSLRVMAQESNRRGGWCMAPTSASKTASSQATGPAPVSGFNSTAHPEKVVSPAGPRESSVSREATRPCVASEDDCQGRPFGDCAFRRGRLGFGTHGSH